MKIIEEKYPNLIIPNELKCYSEPEKVLFFDIETTGLRKESTSIYLIGCGYYENGFLNTIFFFGENPEEEATVLKAFFEYIKRFECIIHFNGTKFDLPYIEYKTKLYSIKNPLNELKSIDLYHEIKPLRYLLFRESMKQKSVEDFLKIERNDQYNGGELIPIYFDYVNSRDDYSFSLLMMHNREDILGMHQIFPILNYLKIGNATLEYENNELISYTDFYGNTCSEMIINYSYDLSLPIPFTIKCNDIYYKFDTDNERLTVRLPISNLQMYHYFDNYKDYYYIPRENICVHKSISSSVDKNERIKATKDNCKVAVKGLALPQFLIIFESTCGPEYCSRNSHFLVDENFDKQCWNKYGYHLINTLLTAKPKRRKKITTNEQ